MQVSFTPYLRSCIVRISDRFLVLILILTAFLSLNCWSQSPLAVTRLNSAITFDGVPDEQAWQDIAPLPMVMHIPVFGISPTEIAEYKIAYDTQYFYVSGILKYTDPGNIRAVGKKRDYSMPFHWGLSFSIEHGK